MAKKRGIWFQNQRGHDRFNNEGEIGNGKKGKVAVGSVGRTKKHRHILSLQAFIEGGGREEKDSRVRDARPKAWEKTSIGDLFVFAKVEG